MSIVLKPMRVEAFDAFAEEAITSYAQDSMVSGRWPEASAGARARADFHALLPHGLATADHFIHEVVEEAAGAVVGFVWFAIRQSGDDRTGYIYSIRIHPETRGRGYAKAAIALVEEIAAREGLRALALHVFGFNTGAQALYRSLGYGITGFNMLKPLAATPA
jgi:ribosomal protein S18 acetylase RimI-like enzyme